MNSDASHPRPWRLVGGDLCLDFVNTVGGRRSLDSRTAPETDRIVDDWLLDFEDLVQWSVFAGVVDEERTARLQRLARRQPADAEETFGRAIRLRAAVYGLGESLIEQRGPAPQDIATLDRELRRAREHLLLVAGDGAVVEVWDQTRLRPDSVLWPIARSAASLFISGPVDRLKRCPGTNCSWLFLDSTRNHGRRWCGMRDCGNLSKVRRYRARQRPTQDG